MLGTVMGEWGAGSGIAGFADIEPGKAA